MSSDPAIRRPEKRPPAAWSREDSAELYSLRDWGHDFVSINERGNLEIRPSGPGGSAIDLKELVDQVRDRGLGLPLLLRFSDLLKSRIEKLHDAFRRAIEEFEYGNRYLGVYPIKVNQDRYLVERLLEHGRPYHLGLEAGSKPELLAVIAMLQDEEALVVCNGYKDEEYVTTALLASRLGRRVIVVIEKPAELPLVARVARDIGVEPLLGLRLRLSSSGSGHWESSAGDRSKFGLGGRELVDAVGYLRQEGLLQSLRLLHFHLGSQVSSIRSFKEALREATRIYVELVRMGAPLEYLDGGGGLGVDYDGSQGKTESSINYSLQEYANDFVDGVMEVCDPAEVDHPILVTESGRALVAHHAVLVVEVLGTGDLANRRQPEEPPEDSEPVLQYLHETYREVGADNLLESYHDALAYRDEFMARFDLGHLALEQRALAEDIFWATCRRIVDLCRHQEPPPELEGLEAALAQTYFCNFSVFQSLPDSWAIEHIFPIVPLHRLDELPSGRAVLTDLTCDSDGKIDRFVAGRGVKRILELHEFQGDPYYLGVFLVGAYQEILGDLHNLFGDTNTVAIALDKEGGVSIQDVVAGDSVTDVLEYVRYDRRHLEARVRSAAEAALRAGRMTIEESRQLLRVYQSGLSGYTYLEDE